MTDETDRSEQGPDPDDFRIPTIAELDAMRVVANLSMKDLSECAGFKTSRFSYILNNETNPQTRTIRAFLTALQEFDGHSTSGNQGPDPSRSGLADGDDGPTEVDVDQIAARLDRLNADDVGDDPTPPKADENLRTDGGGIEGGIELPSTFDEWPREDQLEYLEHTKKKRELIDQTFFEARLDNEADGKTNPSLSKLDWVELFLRVRSLHTTTDGTEAGRNV